MQTKFKLNLCPNDAGLYPADDLPAYIQSQLNKNKPTARTSRTDLIAGQVVIVLEGPHTSSRVIFIKQLKNNMALCTGPYSINKISFFTIDERFLLLTKVKVEFKINVDLSDAPMCMADDYVVERKMNNNEKDLDEMLMNEVSKVKWMKRYFNTPFCVPKDVEFYSINL